MVKILNESAHLHPLEEMFISSTIASTRNRYEGATLGAIVHFEDSLESDGNTVRCEIAILTAAMPVIVVGTGPSPGHAFLCASEGLDRHLFNALRRAPSSALGLDESSLSLAA